MADRGRLPASSLERALADVGSSLAYPASGDVARAVALRLASGERSPALAPLRPVRAGGRVAWRVALAAAVVVAMLGGLVVFSPATRKAVASWLGLGGVKIVVTPSPLPTAIGGPFGLGERVTLAQAQRRVPYRVLLPRDASVGAPDEIYVDDRYIPGQLSLVYRSRPGMPAASTTGAALLLTEFRGAIDRPAMEKLTNSPGTTVETVNVGGEPAFWISGQPHEVFYVDENGRQVADTVRLAANVLVWDRGDLTLRLECALPRERAIAVAESVR